MKASSIAITLVITCGLGLIGLKTWEKWPHGADLQLLGKPTLMPEIMSAGKDIPATPKTTMPPQPTRSPTPALDNLSMLLRYDRLAKSTNPADNKIAYDIVQRCRDAQWMAKRDPDYTEFAREECGDLVMRPGILDDPAFQLALITRAAEAGVHRAYLDMFRNEFKKGRMQDGAETDARFEQLRQIALSTADPYALAEESSRAEVAGDKAAELTYFVAYRAALARDRGENYLPAQDPATQAKARALPDATAKAAIAKGTEFVASAYRTQK